MERNESDSAFKRLDSAFKRINGEVQKQDREIEKQEREFERDARFWDSVDALAKQLTPGREVAKRRGVTGIGCGRLYRMVSWIDTTQWAPSSSALYDYFSRSPEFCLMLKNTVIDLSCNVPMAMGKREWMVKLNNLCCNRDVTAVFYQIDPWFGADAMWDMTSITSIHVPEDTLDQVKGLLNETYFLWVDYIRRHSKQMGTADGGWERLRVGIACLDGMRNQAYRRPVMSTRAFLENTALLDQTLVYVERSCAQDPGTKGRIITREALKAWENTFGLMPKHRPLFEEILFLYQRYLRLQGGPEPAPDFAFIYKGRYIGVRYDKEKRCFVRETNGRPTIGVKCTDVKGEGAFTCPGRYLYELTGGDWDCLCQLAKVVACSMGARKMFPGVIGVEKSNPKNTGEVLALLGHLAGEEIWRENIPTIRQLVKNEAGPVLIQEKLAGRKSMCCCDSKDRLSDAQWKRFRKLCNGATVSYPSKILGGLKHKNNVQWFVLGDDRTWLTFKNHEIPMLMMPEISDARWERDMAAWLQTILPLWGYLLMQQRSPKKPDIKPHTVETFMAARCTILDEPGDFIAARELHEVYREFCKEHGYGDCLLLKDFNASLERDYGLTRGRHHCSKGSNKTGFRQIRLHPETGQDQGEHSGFKEGKDAFLYRLAQIEHEVLSRFPDCPFQVRSCADQGGTEVKTTP